MPELSALGLKSRLKALATEQRATATRISAGAGLYLLVKPSSKPGSGSWVLRFTVDGKRRDMGLGSYPSVSLAEARLSASEAMTAARRGNDPIAGRSARKGQGVTKAGDTFRSVAEALFESKQAEWKNGKHRQQWIGTLEKHAFPKIGGRPVGDVDTGLVLEVLRPLWNEIPETASRVRGRIESVLNYAAAVGLRPPGHNPAAWRGHLSEVLGAPSKLKAAARRKKGRAGNHPSLPFDQAPAFMAALIEKSGMGVLALRFAILTAARSGEVRGMTWAEVDWERRIWAIPAARMKAGRTHFVPLSKQALELLRHLWPLADSRASFVFPGRRDRSALSDMTLSELVRGMSLDGLTDGSLPRWRDPLGNQIVPHGFRSTFKAWSLANGWADHLSELALAHADTNKVRAAYARDPLIEERRPMMQAWADLCCSKLGEDGIWVKNQ